jgi:hypothetical protein
MNIKIPVVTVSTCLLTLMRCGEPIGPVPSSWQKVTEYNPPESIKIEGVVASGNEVDFAITRDVWRESKRELAIVAYKAGGFEDAWSITDVGGCGRMRGLDKIGSFVWAGGTRSEKGEPIKYLPVLIRNTGSGWREIDLGPNPGFCGIGRVYAVSGEVCWLLTDKERAGAWYGSLVLYENGSLSAFPYLKSVTGAYDADAQIFYAIPVKKGYEVEVAITADRGASWVHEKAVLEHIPGMGLENAVIFPAIVYRGDLYFVMGTAIYKRTGAPGAGEYELVFFSNLGPYFRFVDEFAADDTRLMGTGTDTCLIYDGERWQMERLPYEHTSFNGLGAASAGFYATADNETSGELELLFHP